jgi:hypothetical protein
MKIDNGARTAVSELRQAVSNDAERIRTDRNLTEEAKRRQMAGMWLKHRTIAETLRQKAQGDVAAERQRLEKNLFNLNAIVGWVDPHTRASATMAYRSAQDHVATVLRQVAEAGPRQVGESDARTQALTDLLNRAERSGDEFMARAVADAALRVGNADVLNAFSASRPNLEADVDRLWEVSAPTTHVRDVVANELDLVVDPPYELRGLTDYDLRNIAETDQTVTAVAH